jgi:2-phospho-L-lactate guanylyltransferase
MKPADRRSERCCAVLPVKPFGDAKERLATGLTPDQRRMLAEAMVRDVLAALGRAQELTGVVVVSAEPRMAEIADAVADAVLVDELTGHSDAAAAGAAWAAERGFGRVVMLPGDCPLLDAGELDELIARTRADGIEFAVVPDRAGSGTNALVIAPPQAVAPSFGPDSRRRHLALGLAAGRRTAEHVVPTLAHDLDTADDLLALAERLADGDHDAVNTEQAVGALLTDRHKLPGGYAR